MWFKKKATKPMERSLDRLIFEIAERQRPRDVDELFIRLSRQELYSPVATSNVNLADGERVKVQAGMRIELPQVEVNGLRVLLFFANKDDIRLGPRHVGLSLADALGMLEQAPDLDAMVIYNRQQSFAGVLKQQVGSFRERYVRG